MTDIRPADESKRFTWQDAVNRAASTLNVAEAAAITRGSPGGSPIRWYVGACERVEPNGYQAESGPPLQPTHWRVTATRTVQTIKQAQDYAASLASDGFDTKVTALHVQVIETELT